MILKSESLEQLKSTIANNLRIGEESAQFDYWDTDFNCWARLDNLSRLKEKDRIRVLLTTGEINDKFLLTISSKL